MADRYETDNKRAWPLLLIFAAADAATDILACLFNTYCR